MSPTKWIAHQLADAQKQPANCEQNLEEVPQVPQNELAGEARSAEQPQVQPPDRRRRSIRRTLVLAILATLITGGRYLWQGLDGAAKLHDVFPYLRYILDHKWIGYPVSVLIGIALTILFLRVLRRLRPIKAPEPPPTPTDEAIDALRDLLDALQQKGGRHGK